MTTWGHLAPSILASFLASLVEFVEALTVILAVGATRGWRGAIAGTVLALAVLAALVVVLGPALTRLPLAWVQLGVGALLVLFGLRWLRKAILRAAGIIPLHDEAATYAKQTATLRGLDRPTGGWDAVAVATAFQITLLEGIEVVFIVVALGAGGMALLQSAAIGAGAALLVVMALGLLLHRPLATIPENTLKFGVGALLSGFGTFWFGEGMGVEWPNGDLSILALIGAFLVTALAMVSLIRPVPGTA